MFIPPIAVALAVVVPAPTTPGAQQAPLSLEPVYTASIDLFAAVPPVA